MTTQNRAALLLTTIKKTLLDVSVTHYRDRGSGYYDAPIVEDKTPLVQDLEEMIASPLTRREEREVLVETLVVVRVLLVLREEEWVERVRGVFGR